MNRELHLRCRLDETFTSWFNYTFSRLQCIIIASLGIVFLKTLSTHEYGIFSLTVPT